MVTVEELEERIKEIENILTLISREVMEQFDIKIKLAEIHLSKEIDTKMEIAQKSIAEEIRLMFKEIREKFDPYELRKEIEEIRSILKVLELRVSHFEKYLKKSSL